MKRKYYSWEECINLKEVKLYVLQYPLRPCWHPYVLEDRRDKVRLNPKTSELEVEMSAQFDSENFDADVGDDRAMKKQVLSSAWQPPATTRYAVGILMGNKPHLNTVHAVVQIWPSLQHLEPQHPTHDEEMIVPIKDEKTIKQSKKQFYRNIMGESLTDMPGKDLKNLENKLEKAITRIRSKKNELLFAEIEYMQKRELELHNNQFLHAKISENERAQQQQHMSLMPGSSDYELVTPHQPFDGRNYLQTNELQTNNDYSCLDQTPLQLVQVHSTVRQRNHRL